MTRNRQLLRLLHLARPSKRNTAQTEPTHSPRRAFRTLGLVFALALAVAQVVLAVPPENVSFTFSDPTPNDQVLDRSFAASATDADQDIAAYEWDFDFNGTFTVDATGQNPTHTFPAPGSYSIALRVTDGTVNDDQATTTGPVVQSVNVTLQNQNPAASIVSITRQPDQAHPNSGDLPYVGQPVKFDGTGTDPDGDPVTYAWDFGDGESSTREDPVHAYDSHGPKQVRLTVRDNRGGETTSPASTVQVNALPVAGFIVAPENAFVGDTVTLSSTSSDPDDRLMGQEWDLDNDGQFDDASAAVVSARFDRSGTYPLKLRVTDSRGASSTATGRVIVQSRAVPRLQVLPGVEIEARFLLFARDTKIKFLRVRAPAGSKVSVRCRGKKNCPKRLTKMSKGPKKLRFKKLQRMFRPRTKLIITVTKGGFIGKQTRYTMRRRKPPMKRTLCLPPGAKKANACPSG
jgi:PKD repeat protein